MRLLGLLRLKTLSAEIQHSAKWSATVIKKTQIHTNLNWSHENIFPLWRLSALTIVHILVRHQVITQEGERAENNEAATLKPYLVYWAWHVFMGRQGANKWTSRLWQLWANKHSLCIWTFNPHKDILVGGYMWKSWSGECELSGWSLN